MFAEAAKPTDRFGTTLRWTARAFALGVLGLGLLFLVGEGGEKLTALSVREGILMALLWMSFAGLILAWWREGLGGAITVGALASFTAIEWISKGRFPRIWAFGVIAAPALLFLWFAVRARLRHQ